MESLFHISPGGQQARLWGGMGSSNLNKAGICGMRRQQRESLLHVSPAETLKLSKGSLCGGDRTAMVARPPSVHQMMARTGAPLADPARDCVSQVRHFVLT